MLMTTVRQSSIGLHRDRSAALGDPKLNVPTNGVNIMDPYVMIVAENQELFFFVGPFNTCIDACVWSEQHDDIYPNWHLLELNDPAKLSILPPTVRTIASGPVENIIPPAAGERGNYILCWTVRSYHLIGPFGDAYQCSQFINSDGFGDGPYGNPCYYPLLLDVPARSPQVVPPSTPSLSAEEVRQWRLEHAQDDAIDGCLYATWLGSGMRGWRH